ncbi:hypothetical protein AMTRI_Chr12g273940 [Amborella trichopoda]
MAQPPRDEISIVTKMLGDEFSTASKIESTINRQSHLGAITSAQQRLSLYYSVPHNGLVLYTGTMPFILIQVSFYLCDNKFHTEALNELLDSDDKFGFIVMDGNGTLFGALSGNTREVLHKFTVDLPEKHGRGGQSPLRFARLRMEKRHNYILNVIDVSYGGESGFNQAIELSSDILSNYFEEISQDPDKYVFGVDDTLKALKMGAMETIIVWENLDINRYSLKNSVTGEIVVKHLGKDQEADQNNFRDPANSAELEVQEKISLLEWFANEYMTFGWGGPLMSFRMKERLAMTLNSKHLLCALSQGVRPMTVCEQAGRKKPTVRKKIVIFSP